MSRPEPMNVLFVMSHDFGPRVGCLGDAQAVTPHMDRLAADRSACFTKHYANHPLCGPSRACLWTGCRPDTTQRYDNREFFPPFRRRMGTGFVTLPQAFKRAGRTSIGVWHLLHDLERDDASFSQPCWHPPQPTALQWPWVPPPALESMRWWIDPASFDLMRQRMRTWTKGGGTLDDPRRYRGPAVEAPDADDDAYVEGQATAQAVRWLDEHGGDGPFFLGVGYEIGHLPFCSPRRHWNLYDRDALQLPTAAAPPPGTPDWVPGDKEAAQYYWQHSYDRDWHPSEAQTRELIHGHYAAMSYFDAQVGRLLDALDARGLRQRTIVVVTADHGFTDGQHGYFGKHNLWDESMHVPLIVHAPHVLTGAMPIDRVTEHVDLFPTLCELAGIATPPHTQGRSLAPLLADPAGPWKDAAWSVRRPMYHDRHRVYHEGRSVRTPRYRYTAYHDAAGGVLYEELFDYERDPHALENRIDSAGDALRAELRAIAARPGHCNTTGAT